MSTGAGITPEERLTADMSVPPRCPCEESRKEKVAGILRQWFFESRALPTGKGLDLEGAVWGAAQEICQLFEPKHPKELSLLFEEQPNLQGGLLTEEEAIAAYENNNPADDHAIGVVEVAKAQMAKDQQHEAKAVKAARREVVEWFLGAHPPFNIFRFLDKSVLDFFRSKTVLTFWDADIEAQLKAWGISNSTQE